MVKLSDVEDFVELYQKTRQTLHQQIKDVIKEETKDIETVQKHPFGTIEAIRLRVLALLDQPNEDYIVIPKSTVDIQRLRVNAFERRITNEWVTPIKGELFYEKTKVTHFTDESPEGYYPSCIVPKQHLGKVVTIIPLENFFAKFVVIPREKLQDKLDSLKRSETDRDKIIPKWRSWVEELFGLPNKKETIK